MMTITNDIDLAKVKVIKKNDNNSIFEIEPLSPGYGVTLGHALRRVLLSSLKGTAVTSVKFENTTHEFSTIKGVKEDVMDIILNLKHLTLKLLGDEPVTLKLSKKGPGKVLAKDFKKDAQVEILDPEFHIATLEKDGKLNMEITVEKGYGYVPVESRQDVKLPLGTIAIDAIFNPVKKINYNVENTRVGGETNYNKLTIDISTNGTITPEDAYQTSVKLLLDYLSIIQTKKEVAAPKKTAKKTKSK